MRTGIELLRAAAEVIHRGGCACDEVQCMACAVAEEIDAYLAIAAPRPSPRKEVHRG